MTALPFLERLGRGLVAACAASLVLVACGGGGGGGGDGVGSGGTGSFAVGPISGFGSVIVNGIRYDDSGAEVLDDDGNRVGSDDLRLGMVIEVTGSGLAAGATGPTGSASTIRFASEIVGPVETVDVAAGTLRVFGQDVDVTATTVFDADLAGGLAAVQTGLQSGTLVVEVYALGNGTRYTATRIERKGGSVEQYRLRGPVRDLDSAARTFRIGATLVSYAGLSEVPALSNGTLVRVRVAVTPVNGAYVAERLRSGARQVEDRDEAEIEGLVTAIEAGNPRRFSVDGIPVDAQDAEFDDGSPADLAVGVRVEVEGRLEGGVLIAREVELEDEDGRGGDDDDGAGGDDDDDRGVIELEGRISALDTANQRFVLRGVTIDYTAATFDDGGEGRLANDVELEVDGRLAADGVTVEALKVDFED